jgi:hypothetical protein
MEATDMLDVIHYFFEDDLAVASAEQQEARSNTRSSVYRTLYGTTYKYAIKKSGSEGGSYTYAADGSEIPTDGFYGTDEDITPFDPNENVKKATKPFVPATDMDADSPLPFGRVLDAPLN